VKHSVMTMFDHEQPEITPFTGGETGFNAEDAELRKEKAEFNWNRWNIRLRSEATARQAGLFSRISWRELRLRPEGRTPNVGVGRCRWSCLLASDRIRVFNAWRTVDRKGREGHLKAGQRV
jgi:hypothetical protein